MMTKMDESGEKDEYSENKSTNMKEDKYCDDECEYTSLLRSLISLLLSRVLLPRIFLEVPKQPMYRQASCV